MGLQKRKRNTNPTVLPGREQRKVDVHGKRVQGTSVGSRKSEKRRIRDFGAALGASETGYRFIVLWTNRIPDTDGLKLVGWGPGDDHLNTATEKGNSWISFAKRGLTSLTGRKKVGCGEGWGSGKRERKNGILPWPSKT